MCLECVWGVFGKWSGNVREVFGKFLGSVWEVLGNASECLGALHFSRAAAQMVHFHEGSGGVVPQSYLAEVADLPEYCVSIEKCVIYGQHGGRGVGYLNTHFS